MLTKRRVQQERNPEEYFEGLGVITPQGETRKSQDNYPETTTYRYKRHSQVRDYPQMNDAVRPIWSVTNKNWTYYECDLKRPSGKILRNIAVFTNLATDDTYNFFAGWGCERSLITDDMLYSVSRWMNDFYANIYFGSVWEVYYKLLREREEE